jgi:Pentapeptide repeats (9 copies)
MFYAGEPESEGEEEKAPKIKAEDNPWYLLATLYSVSGDDKTINKNRVTWNRYFAANLDAETRTKLIEEKRHPAEELTPLSLEELQEVATAFAERRKASGVKLALPDSSADINFSNVEFDQDASFKRYLFSRSSSFQDSTFSSGAIFDGATFAGATFSFGASFERAAVSVEASFATATFSGGASFERAALSGGANFYGATFSHGADFLDATFSGVANLGGAAFSGLAYFSGAAFSVVDFGDAAFSGRADFRKVTFGETSTFVNAEMKGETSFEGATFNTKPPRFFNAKLHQGTVWRDITWPPRPKDKDEAGAFIDAYACLKLEMDRLKKHEDELNFFALELQSRHVEQGSMRGLPIWLYGVLSGYGRSYLRPLGALFVVAAIGAGAFWYFDARTYGEALGLSAANTLNVFGFRRDFGLAIDTPFAWLKVFSALQTILGTVLLFLFGLGIRNKFRMK